MRIKIRIIIYIIVTINVIQIILIIIYNTIECNDNYISFIRII